MVSRCQCFGIILDLAWSCVHIELHVLSSKQNWPNWLSPETIRAVTHCVSECMLLFTSDTPRLMDIILHCLWFPTARGDSMPAQHVHIHLYTALNHICGRSADLRRLSYDYTICPHSRTSHLFSCAGMNLEQFSCGKARDTYVNVAQ